MEHRDVPVNSERLNFVVFQSQISSLLLVSIDLKVYCIYFTLAIRFAPHRLKQDGRNNKEAPHMCRAITTLHREEYKK